MRFLFIALMFFVSAFAFGQAKPIFRIGKPDACAGEFKFFRNINDCIELGDKSGKKYRDVDGSGKFYENPPVFVVGKSKDAHWPFAHPIINCAWNNWKPSPTLKIEFQKPKTKAEFVYLKIGVIDVSSVLAGVKVELNGKEISKRMDFFYTKNWPQKVLARTMLYNKGAKNKPSNPYVIKIKTSDLKEGKNVISLRGYVHKNAKTYSSQWLVYDFIELSEDSKYPKIPNYTETLLPRAIKAMGTEEVIFCVSGSSRGGHWYENIGNICSADDDTEASKARSNAENFSRLGARLVKFNLKTRKYKILLEDKEGGIRDPRLHYDAKKILFSYRKGKSDKFRLYEIDIDGKNLRELPTNSTGNDVEPCYLPNDDIMFCSDRKGRTVQCWMSPALNLHRYFAKEKIVRCMSGNPDVDNTPNVLRDGRVLYMRWDYNHRNQLKYHHLWSINPDGSNNSIYYGNAFPWGVFLNPRQVPDSEDVIFTASYGHGQTNNAGAIAKLSPPFDPSDMYAIKFVRSDSRNFEPYPLKDNIILTTDGRDIYILDHNGAIVGVSVPAELFETTGESYMHSINGNENKRGRKCWMTMRNVQPVMKTQRENLRPDMADFSKKTASVFLQDVYIGRNLKGVKRGSIKKLLILQVLPTPVNFSGIYLPTGFGGSFALEGVLGTVPVYEDGSAFFEVPANVGIAFVALDENNNSVKRMMSSTNFAPATQTSCIGCHEHRTDAPMPKQKLPIAYRKGISKIQKIEGIDLIVDYMRDIQPLIDKYCVECHNPRNPKGKGVILSKAIGERYITGRVVLQGADMCAVDWSGAGDFKPYSFGSGGSRLARFAEGKHHNKKFSEKDMNILKAWLDIGAPHISTYAAKDTGFPRTKRLRVYLDMNNTLKDAIHVLYKRCMSCHGLKWKRWSYDGANMLTLKKKNKGHKVLHIPFAGLLNFIDPENSPAAVVPLAKSAGGFAQGTEKGSHPIVFKDKNDADYKMMLASTRKTSEQLEQMRPPITSKNFYPSYGYVKKMQEIGLLPKDWNPKTPLDPYKIDEAYIRFQAEP